MIYAVTYLLKNWRGEKGRMSLLSADDEGVITLSVLLDVSIPQWRFDSNREKTFDYSAVTRTDGARRTWFRVGYWRGKDVLPSTFIVSYAAM